MSFRGVRPAGSEAERAVLEAIRSSLPASTRATVESCLAMTRPDVARALHVLLAAFGAALGLFWPAVGAVVVGVAGLGLALEADGRMGPMRLAWPRRPAYNLDVALPAPTDVGGTVVLVIPADTPRGPPFRRFAAWRHVAVLVAGSAVWFALRAMDVPWDGDAVWIGAALVAGATLSVGELWPFGPAAEDAGTPRIWLELLDDLARNPPPALAIRGVVVAAGHAGGDGLGAWLARHGRLLADPVLFIGLDAVGQGPFAVADAEVGLIRHPHRPTGPALAERVAWAGQDIGRTSLPATSLLGPAVVDGRRTALLVGRGGDGPGDGARQRVRAMIELFASDVVVARRAGAVGRP